MAALYSGLSAALARQASYTTLRLGLYDLLKRLVLDRELYCNSKLLALVAVRCGGGWIISVFVAVFAVSAAVSAAVVGGGGMFAGGRLGNGVGVLLLSSC